MGIGNVKREPGKKTIHLDTSQVQPGSAESHLSSFPCLHCDRREGKSDKMHKSVHILTPHIRSSIIVTPFG